MVECVGFFKFVCVRSLLLYIRKLVVLVAYQDTIAEMLTEADLIATKIGFKLELRPMIVRGLRLSLFGRSV